MITISKKEFINEYLRAINENYAAIFAGAGLSRSSGFVDWKELLSDVAGYIGLDSKKENDLIAVAQYYKNERGSRSSINQLLINKFTSEVDTNENIKLLAMLPIDTYWTTNYDSLIESQLKKYQKIVDVKTRQEDLTITVPKRDAVIYKMHGDIGNPSQAVLTKDDYEAYNLTHSVFTTALQGDLISKTFLFIGFSFEDPNLNSILARIRVLLSENQRTHYCIMKKVMLEDFDSNEEYIYSCTKQELRIKDLLRYSINTILVNKYTEITELLETLYRKYMAKRIFISGSAHVYGNIKDAPQFLTKLAKTLIHKDYHIISGFGNGIGNFIISGALDEIMNFKNMNVEHYLTIRPRPSFDIDTQNGAQLQNQYHESMIKNAGIVLFLFGNKEDENHELINSPGVLEEFQIAKKNNKYILPLGSTGYAAKEVFNYIRGNIKDFDYLSSYIHDLETVTNTDELINVVLQILDDIYNETADTEKHSL